MDASIEAKCRHCGKVFGVGQVPLVCPRCEERTRPDGHLLSSELKPSEASRVAWAISQAETLQRPLQRWLRIYLGFLVAVYALGAVAVAVQRPTDHLLPTEADALPDAVLLFVVLLALAALVPYVCALSYAYRLKSALNTAGLHKHGAWQVIVGGLILNPWFLGICIPVSVLSTARRVLKRQSVVDSVVGSSGEARP